VKTYLLTYEQVFTSSTQNRITTWHKLAALQGEKGNVSGSTKPEAKATVVIMIIIIVITMIN